MSLMEVVTAGKCKARGKRHFALHSTSLPMYVYGGVLISFRIWLLVKHIKARTRTQLSFPLEQEHKTAFWVIKRRWINELISPAVKLYIIRAVLNSNLGLRHRIFWRISWIYSVTPVKWRDSTVREHFIRQMSSWRQNNLRQALLININSHIFKLCA
jgi:hypothetical protein